MKKISILALIAAVGLGFAACDEYTLPNPPAQTNPDGNVPVYDVAGLTVTSQLSAQALDLTAYRDDVNKTIKVASYALTEASALPEGYTMAAKFVLGKDNKFAESDTIATVVEGNDMLCTVEQLNQAFIKLYGYNPAAKDVYTQIIPYAVNGTSIVRLGKTGVLYADNEYTFTPVGYGYVIESEYYLVGNFCDWDLGKGVKFTKLEDGDPYDHPNFMAAIFVEEDLALAGGCEWKVVPGSSVSAGTWDGAWGVSKADASASEGVLVAAPAAKTDAGILSQPGNQSIKVNMRNLTFEEAPAYEMLWVPGMGSHTTNFDKILPIPTNDFIHYEGTQSLYGNFWFTAQPSLKGISFRPDGDATVDEATGVESGKMHYDPTSTQKMKVPSSGYGLYYIQANVVELTWSITPIPVINIIGAFNGWDAEKAPALTPDKKKAVWTINDVELEGEFKFCVNNAWTYSYGGALDNIVQNGGNLSAEKGKYDVELHFDVYPNYVKLTAK